MFLIEAKLKLEFVVDIKSNASVGVIHRVGFPLLAAHRI